MKKFFTAFFIAAAGIISAMAADVPTYPGGDEAMNKFIAENLRYPLNAKENGVEGVVTVSFMVSPEGRLSQLKVVKFVDPDLEEEAVRIVSLMPAWIPAEKNGVSVEAPSKVEIPFILEE